MAVSYGHGRAHLSCSSHLRAFAAARPKLLQRDFPQERPLLMSEGMDGIDGLPGRRATAAGTVVTRRRTDWRQPRRSVPNKYARPADAGHSSISVPIAPQRRNPEKSESECLRRRQLGDRGGCGLFRGGAPSVVAGVVLDGCRRCYCQYCGRSDGSDSAPRLHRGDDQTSRRQPRCRPPSGRCSEPGLPARPAETS